MRSGPSRVLAILVGAVVLLAVVAAIVVSHRTAPVLDRGTPEGVVQEYLQAVLAEDYPAAAALLAPSSGCDIADVASASAVDSDRVVLTHSSIDGDTAVVTVEVTSSSADDPFGSSGYSHTERLTLQRVGGAWKIAGSSWLLYPCAATKG